MGSPSVRFSNTIDPHWGSDYTDPMTVDRPPCSARWLMAAVLTRAFHDATAAAPINYAYSQSSAITKANKAEAIAWFDSPSTEMMSFICIMIALDREPQIELVRRKIAAQSAGCVAHA